jgi:MYXO-CTERM domain-containing protein
MEMRELAAPSASGGMAMKKAQMAPRNDDLGVTVEAKFEVGEYQIVILSAKESTGLDKWLRLEKYNIPKGAEPLLRPYVESGMKFFVAKVDVKKVNFVDGRAELSPLRFHYDQDQFVLPIRLGLANSSGTQDLIVNILAPGQRYEVANYKNVTIPTNIDLKPDVKERFGAFYASLFDRTIEKNPGAVVTEYAWQATTCDPCPGPALNYHDFMLLGADVLDLPKRDPNQQIATDAQSKPANDPWKPIAQAPPPPGMNRRVPRSYGNDFVLTRLHARYGKDLRDDLSFKEAAPIVGGREHVIDPQTQQLEQGAQAASMNNFQGRYAIRYPWTGPIDCPNPRRGVWGGPPNGGRPPTKPALDLAFAPRGEVQLASAVVPTDLPEIGLKAGVLEVIAKPPAPAPTPETLPGAPHGERGCGCQTNDPRGFWLLALVLGPALRRRCRKA